VLLFEVAKLVLAGGWQRRAVIALAQIALPIDCVRAFAPDWWHYFTGLYSGGARCPWIAALFTLAAIVAVLFPAKE